MAGQDRRRWFMSRLAPAKAEPKTVKRIILKRHACDQCGYASDGSVISTARYEVRTAKGPLFFCRHHYLEHCHVLLASGIEVVDQENLTVP
jgi:hypothetical protein